MHLIPVASLFAQNFALPWFFFHIHCPVNKFVGINIKNIVTRKFRIFQKHLPVLVVCILMRALAGWLSDGQRRHVVHGVST
jgi:hypothetical protein